MNSYMQYRILFADCTSQQSLVDTSFPNIFYVYFRGVHICAKKERSCFCFWGGEFCGIRLSQNFETPGISNENPGISIENHGFQSKNPVFQISFLGVSHTEL